MIKMMMMTMMMMVMMMVKMMLMVLMMMMTMNFKRLADKKGQLRTKQRDEPLRGKLALRIWHL